MNMLFAAAMQAVANGKMVRRATWRQDVVLGPCLAASVSILSDGSVQLVHPVIVSDPMRGNETYNASVADRGADDWESVVIAAPAQAAAESRYLLPDGELPSEALDSDPGSPAAQADAQPEDAGNPPAAPLATQGTPQEGVSFAAGGTSPAVEDTTTIQEVVQDAGAPTAPGGV